MEHPLNRDAKWKALRTFIRVQLGARMLRGNVCVQFPNDTMLLVPPTMKGAAHYLFPGLAEFDEMSFVMHFLRPGDLFIDVGANLGAFTILAGGVAGARSIAFEPSPSTFDFLTRNIRLNGLLGLAEGRNLALGSGEGKVSFTTGLGTENHISRLGSGEATVEVPLTTLDTQLIGKLPSGDSCIVMKMDVEGFEDEVAAGGRALLPQLHALLIERSGQARRFGKDEADLHAHVRKLGLIPCHYDPSDRKLSRVSDELSGCNIIYIRDLTKANERLREAAQYRFSGRCF
jgi:FkbM family methyltransferase